MDGRAERKKAMEEGEVGMLTQTSANHQHAWLSQLIQVLFYFL